MLIAHLTDPHILAPGALLFGRIDTAAFLARAVETLLELNPRPDIVVITGDLVENGEPGEYAQLRRLLAPLPMPVYVIPGNHDAREPLREAFAAHGYLPASGFLHYALDSYPLRVIALDTLIPGQGGGTLCPERLAWLEERLAAEPEKPTVLMMHHPPFVTGIARMDGVGFDAAPALAGVVQRFPQIQRILCGHLHRAIDSRFAGTIAGTAPGAAHQFRLG